MSLEKMISRLRDDESNIRLCFEIAEKYYENREFENMAKYITKGLQCDIEALPFFDVFDEEISNGKVITFIIPKRGVYSQAMTLDGFSFFSRVLLELLRYLISTQRINIILSLNNVEFLADAGEGIIWGIKREARMLQGDLKCINPHSNILRVSEIMGNSYFDLYPTAVEAIQAFMITL